MTGLVAGFVGESGGSPDEYAGNADWVIPMFSYPAMGNVFSQNWSCSPICIPERYESSAVRTTFREIYTLCYSLSSHV